MLATDRRAGLLKELALRVFRHDTYDALGPSEFAAPILPKNVVFHSSTLRMVATLIFQTHRNKTRAVLP